MYAICTVVYGIPLNSNDANIDWSEELENALDDDQYEGLETRYSGAGDCTPAFFGVELSEFNEACHHVEVSKLKLEPKQKDLDQYKLMYDQLPQTLQQEITSKYGQPRTFFLWSTS